MIINSTNFRNIVNDFIFVCIIEFYYQLIFENELNNNGYAYYLVAKYKNKIESCNFIAILDFYPFIIKFFIYFFLCIPIVVTHILAGYIIFIP